MVKTEINAIHPAVFMNQPLAAPHQSFLTIGSEVPLVKKSSFPPGEAKRRLRELIPFNVPIHSGNGGLLKIPIIYKLFTHAIVLATQRGFSIIPVSRFMPGGRILLFCKAEFLPAAGAGIGCLPEFPFSCYRPVPPIPFPPGLDRLYIQCRLPAPAAQTWLFPPLATQRKPC